MPPNCGAERQLASDGPSAREPIQVIYPDARILVFAKAPIPGLVKTRLIPALGAEGAAQLAADMLVHLLERLALAHLAPLQLWCAPTADHPLFRRLAERHGVVLHVQHGADLGVRLRGGAEQALSEASRVLLIGADIPDLDADYCARALRALSSADAVIGPVLDGGYGLLGLKRAAPPLFERMPWGTSRVGAITRRRIIALGWSCAELPRLRDLDRPDDLVALGSSVMGRGAGLV